MKIAGKKFQTKSLRNQETGSSDQEQIRKNLMISPKLKVKNLPKVPHLRQSIRKEIRFKICLF